MRILLAGGSGLIGSALQSALRADQHEVVRLVRRAPNAPDERAWQPESRPLDPAVLDGVDAVIGLSGASVGRIPWTPGYRRELRASRLVPTAAIATAIATAAHPPAVWLNASAVGFYGDRGDEQLDEGSAPGSGFLPELVRDWEAAASTSGATRVVQLRSGVVVANGGGFAPVQLTTRLGLGARFGDGRQFWPWISLADEVAAIRHLLTAEVSGPVNLVGPTPATSDEVTAEYARQLHRRRLLVAPRFAVRMLGEAGQRLLLDSARVRPAALAASGFRWQHERIADAVAAVITSAR